MSVYNLDNWGITSTDSGYVAPEARKLRLTGTRLQDNREVITSAIVNVEGRVITTETGSTYILGEPDPEYLDYLQENGIVYNQRNPISVNKPCERLEKDDYECVSVRDFLPSDYEPCQICDYDHKYDKHEADQFHAYLANKIKV